MTVYSTTPPPSMYMLKYIPPGWMLQGFNLIKYEGSSRFPHSQWMALHSPGEHRALWRPAVLDRPFSEIECKSLQWAFLLASVQHAVYMVQLLELHCNKAVKSIDVGVHLTVRIQPHHLQPVWPWWHCSQHLEAQFFHWQCDNVFPAGLFLMIKFSVESWKLNNMTLDSFSFELNARPFNSI